MWKRRRPRLETGITLGFMLGFTLTACGVAQSSDPAADGLRAVDIPASFDFATSRAVALTVRSDAPDVGVEVRLPTQGILYRGPVPTAPLELAVPSKDTRLIVKAYGAKSTVQEVTLHDNSAEVSL